MEIVEDGTAPEPTSLDRWYYFVVAWAPVLCFMGLECWMLVWALSYFL